METTDILRAAAFQSVTDVPYLWLIALFPFVGAAINGILGKKLQDAIGKKANHTIAIGAMLAAFAVACVAFVRLLGLPAGERTLRTDLFPMFEVGDFRVHFSFVMDQLSGTMALIITGIGTLIHIYSTGYMAEEKAYWRFFCYLNLFVFAMLLLVLGDTFVLMFFGWEGVGLCSYLLIGFWYQDFAKATAGMKAFVVNRVGDFAFVCGLFLLFWSVSAASTAVKADRVDDRGDRYAQVTRLDPAAEEPEPAGPAEVRLGGTVHFGELQQQLALTERAVDGTTTRPVVDRLLAMDIAGIPVVFLICLFFFVGATGKSAQIPLYVWLPDAMAGPTPVSALIHAATMVTAGVYMIARLNFLYFLSPGAMSIVAFVGAATSLFAATMALFQYDIKKVLAYSTVSQLGFMFIGVGVGAWWVGVFHLLTHACFKACLFLGSGSVIHGMHFLEHHGHGDGDHDDGPTPHSALRNAPDPHDPQDMRNMGGLASVMPKTRLTYLIACISIAGFPIAAGFYSKDEILWKAMSNGATLVPGWLIWAIGFLAAGCTAFYMFRSYYMTFHRREPTEDIRKHCHESPLNMTGVLWVLAVLAVVTGALGLPHYLGFHPIFEAWLEPVMANGPFREAEGVFSSHALEYALVFASIAIATAGFLLARYFYFDERRTAARMAALKARYDRVHELLYNKYWVDELYQATFVRGFKATARWLAWFDAHIIDWAVNFVGAVGRAAAWLGGFIDRMFVDGAVNGVAHGLLALGRQARRIQTGRINNYALGIAVGVVLLAILGHFAN
ncbi:MAG: NADH-quinone oxidoreductase subunit L [Deltaproteobacteria bacterium]|nr:MAG: NADH-quinone oxidoreductase subunit L [Deltaproteobacteria bacterium]